MMQRSQINKQLQNKMYKSQWQIEIKIICLSIGLELRVGSVSRLSEELYHEGLLKKSVIATQQLKLNWRSYHGYTATCHLVG